MIKNQIFIAAALFVGVAIGYVMKPDRTSAVSEEKGSVAAAKIGDKGDAASLAALRSRIAELERLLAAKDAEKPAAQVVETKPAEQAQGERRGPPSMKEMRERMEKLEKEDPQRFAQITNGMARWRQRRVERANEKLDFLSSVDTGGMTDEQRAAHEKYQSLIERRERLEEKMQNAGLTDAERDGIFGEMRETDRALRQAARTERETLIDQTAKALGFTGDDAEAVSATIRDVISATDQHHHFGPPPPDGGNGAPR